jgi:4-diphosphocytidyl-2-C-methyl-D-erythritol kinase
MLLLKPPFAVSTAWAYSRWQDSHELSGIQYAAQEFDGQTFVNDLERPVFEKYVFLAELKSWLLRQPAVLAALMSGSGSTVFAALRDTTAGEAVMSRARAELDSELWACRCETLCSPEARDDSTDAIRQACGASWRARTRDSASQ